MHNSALFLDRDGVINVDLGYIHRSDQFEFVPGIFELARFWTNELRRPIVVVTNQSGIGRGYFDENTYAGLTRWMCDRFEAERTAITRVYHCPYHPVDGINEYRCDHSMLELGGSLGHYHPTKTLARRSWAGRRCD